MFLKNRKNRAGANLIYADTGAPEQGAKELEKRSRRLAIALVALAVALGAALGVMTLVIGLRSREECYADARTLAADRDYEDALAAFEDLGDYRDSRDWARRLKEQQAAYNTALDLLHQQRYEEAQAAFRALGDYDDSAVMAAYHVTYQKALDLQAEIATGQTRLLTRILADQVKLTDERSYPTIVGYETAAALLDSLGDYRSAVALKDRCYYSAGLVRLSWEDWEGALGYLDRMTEETAAEFYQVYQQYYQEKTAEEG